MKNYKIFTRNWWKINEEKDENGNFVWSNGLEPDGNGNKRTIGHAETVEAAREMCKEYNDNNKEGKLAKRAEYRLLK